MKNSEKLLYYLYQRKNWIKSSELSDYLSVSKRQIRKYITYLNDETEMILSGPLGYKINENQTQSFSYQKKQPKTEKERRRKYIIKKLLFHPLGYDLFDLADELYVSETTVKKDIHELRFSLQKFTLRITRKKNIICMIGSEKSMRDLIFSQLSACLFDFTILNQELDFYGFSYDYKEVLSVLKENLLLFNFSFDDFTLINLAMQYLILLQRIQSGCFLETLLQNQEEIPKNCILAASAICLFFEKKYKIQFNETEPIHFALLIQNHISQTGNISFHSLNHYNLYLYVDYKYIKIAKELIKKTEDQYCLPEFDENFMSKFALYVQNLFLYSSLSFQVKNPLNTHIRLTYPLIYDMASFLIRELKSSYPLCLSEKDRIFLTYHIGSYFEEASYFQQPKVNCVFIYIHYYDFYKITLNKISLKYTNKINISQVLSISDLKKINSVKPDLIILPSGVNLPSAVPAVSLDLFPTETDYIYLEKIINKISSEKKQTELKLMISDFFHESLFFKNPPLHTRDEILKEILDQSAAYSLAEKSLYQEIRTREDETPSIFQNIAVPHILDGIDSKKVVQSFIAVALFEKGIFWSGEKTVYLVFFIGISYPDCKKFLAFYDWFIRLFDQPGNVQKLLKSTSYAHFIQILNEIFLSK